MDHMTHWRAMARPPATALETISGGRLSGMTEVNPQWRYQAMTEQFGMCGVGWKYTIDKLWTEPGADGEVLAFAQVTVAIRLTDGWTWSQPIAGIGGNHMVMKEVKGLHNNDECWKMAVTDALSVALKMLGVAADIYAGLWDGNKYLTTDTIPELSTPKAPDGFENWLMDLELLAAEGTSALEKAWKTSPPPLRKYLTDTDKAKWERIKTQAANVTKSLR